MLRDIDQKLGPIETTEHGLLRKEYVLKLHKIIVYHNCRASQHTVKQERQLRRQYIEYKKWNKYKEAIRKFQDVRYQR